jgi:hypothetical protein
LLLKGSFRDRRRKYPQAGQGWFIPIILVTQEAEIRRIEDQSQPGQIVRETLYQKHSSERKELVE